ncbi:urease accessory protein UreH [SAR116 cluster alpha proteobacterium HIMB100]|nr:urease accessory protein UreH [SAR116 cluster alpha proteobacterium HIMB100]
MDGLISPKLQRARGRISLHLAGRKLAHLYQSGCAKLMLPKTYGQMTEAVMLNTAGGMTGGDRLDVTIRADNCALVATTQTAERLYRSSTEPAQLDIQLHAEQAATLHWIPQETIIFDSAELDRTIRLDLSADSSCLLAETLILGREAMGEQIDYCHFTDNWRLYRDGQLFHAESFRLTDRVAEVLAAPAGGNGARLLSTIIYAGRDADQLAEAVRAAVEHSSSVCAASYWQDRLVIRLMSPHPPSARADINSLLFALRAQPLPRVWQV